MLAVTYFTPQASAGRALYALLVAAVVLAVFPVMMLTMPVVVGWATKPR